MKPLRPDTFMLTLPSGQIVRCWQKDRERIRTEVRRFGSVMLLADNRDGDVYRYIPRGSEEYRLRAATARPG